MKNRVLIIDDDEILLDEIGEALTNAGFEVIKNSHGTAAALAADVMKPDIVLLDLRMPVQSGFEVAAEIKSIKATSDIPIITMTAFYNEDDHSFLTRLCGIKKCFKKPIDLPDLIAEIRNVIGESAKKQ